MVITLISSSASAMISFIILSVFSGGARFMRFPVCEWPPPERLIIRDLPAASVHV